MRHCVSLVVSSGRGERFGGTLPKQYRHLAGHPVLRHCLRAFADHPRIDAVRAVIHPGDLALYDEAAQGLALLEPAHGGATRQDSVRLGLESLAALPRLDDVGDDTAAIRSRLLAVAEARAS